jgi:hypothetical protein
LLALREEVLKTPDLTPAFFYGKFDLYNEDSSSFINLGLNYQAESA